MTSEMNHASAHVPQLQLKSVNPNKMIRLTQAAGVGTSSQPLAVMFPDVCPVLVLGLPHLELQETGNPPSKLRSVSFGRMRGAIKRPFGGLHLQAWLKVSQYQCRF